MEVGILLITRRVILKIRILNILKLVILWDVVAITLILAVLLVDHGIAFVSVAVWVWILLLRLLLGLVVLLAAL